MAFSMPKLTAAQWALLALNALVVLGFGAYYVTRFNYEFLAYAVSIVLIIAALYLTLPVTRFPTGIIAGITIWGILHMMGGSIRTPDGVLYDWRVLPIFDGGGEFFILKMDQFVHAFLYGVVGLMWLHLLQVVVGIRTHRAFIAATAIFAAAGFAILNEIIEFLAVVNLPETGVGGYHNTVLDLIFNLLGAAVAVIAATLMGAGRERAAG